MKASKGMPRALLVLVIFFFVIGVMYFAKDAQFFQVAEQVQSSAVTDSESAVGSELVAGVEDAATGKSPAEPNHMSADHESIQTQTVAVEDAVGGQGITSVADTNTQTAASNESRPLADKPASTTPQPSVVSPAASVAGAATSSLDARAPDQLALAFADECWVEVSDANGDVLATELQAPGSSLLLKGKAPFNVMLGNVRAVTLTINGQPVNAEPKGNNRALRFTVSATE